MGQSMEALIHHFKLVTEGFRVPAGPGICGHRGAPRRTRRACGLRRRDPPVQGALPDPSFNNLQAVPAMSEGGQVADVVAAVASIDPVMGGVDR